MFTLLKALRYCIRNHKLVEIYQSSIENKRWEILQKNNLIDKLENRVEDLSSRIVELQDDLRVVAESHFEEWIKDHGRIRLHSDVDVSN